MKDVQQFAEGIGFWFVGFLLTGFGIWCAVPQKKTGGLHQCSGRVSAVDQTAKTVTVTYCYNRQQFTAVLNEALRAALSELPAEGAEVTVNLEPDKPEHPCSVSYPAAFSGMGRGASFGRSANGLSSKRRNFWMIVCGITFMLLGIYQTVTA